MPDCHRGCSPVIWPSAVLCHSWDAPCLQGGRKIIFVHEIKSLSTSTKSVFNHNEWGVINVSLVRCVCAVEDRGWEDVVCGLSNKLPLTPVEAGREGWSDCEAVRASGLRWTCPCLCVWVCVFVCVYLWVCVLVSECVLVCEKCACVSFCVCCTGMWKLNGAFQFYCSSPRGWETGCHGYPGFLPLMGGSLCSSGNLACLGWNTSARACVYACVRARVCVCVCVYQGGVVGWRQHSRTQEVTYVRTQASIPVRSCSRKRRLLSCKRVLHNIL